MSEKSDIHLVLGGASSGKSAWAEAEVFRSGGRPVYFATARLLDREMRDKAELHARRRGGAWTLLETPDDLASACAASGEDDTVVIDCATMWLTNRMMDEEPWAPAADLWIAAMAAAPARFVVVSNDLSGGVVPENAMARRFQRMQGELNQRLAAAADRVHLVTAGLAQRLK